MSNKTFLSNEFIQNSKCGKCKKYLSVPPTYISSNNPICGRCVNSNKNCGGSRAHFYEELAAFMFFPCVNDIYGCSVKTPFKDVLSHEVTCKFARIVCPIIGCDSQIGSDEVLHHCKVNHEKYILSQNHFLIASDIYKTETSNCQRYGYRGRGEYGERLYDYFTYDCKGQLPVPIGTSYKENKLFIQKEQLFIIQIAFGQTKDIFLRISSFNEAKSFNFKCNLSGKATSHSLCLNEFKTMPYTSKFPEYSANEKIHVSALQNILGPEIRCTFIFDDENKPNNFGIGNDKMLFELECPVCTNYMKPPIFMCSVGHSLCQKCRQKLQVCPSCSTGFSETRNYSLEKISEMVICHCRYKDEGCDFQGNIKNIELHELHCSKSQENETNCFLGNTSSCTWSGSYAKSFEHISLSHPDYCVNLKHRLFLDLSMLTTQTMFLQYDKKVFKVYVNMNHLEIEWAMFYYTNNKKEVENKYMFYIDFVKDNRVFRFNEVCRPIVGNSCQQNNTYVNLPIHLINSFAQQNQLPFTLDIVKFG